MLTPQSETTGGDARRLLSDLGESQGNPKMEDFAARTYGTSSGLDNRPLFGETSARVSVELDEPPQGARPVWG